MKASLTLSAHATAHAESYVKSNRANANRAYVRDLIEKRGWTQQVEDSARLEIAIAMSRIISASKESRLCRAPVRMPNRLALTR